MPDCSGATRSRSAFGTPNALLAEKPEVTRHQFLGGRRVSTLIPDRRALISQAMSTCSTGEIGGVDGQEPLL